MSENLFGLTVAADKGLDDLQCQRLLSENRKYQEVMLQYRCALKALESRLEILNEEFSLQHDRNPIESMKSRLKSPSSIMNKMQKRGLSLDFPTMQANIMDIAGVRVICSFEEDVFFLAKCLKEQSDIEIITEKDYISHPKPNGYRSLHLTIRLPVFFAKKEIHVPVEIQLRTIAMDFWASLEHTIRYKKNLPINAEVETELKECADSSREWDSKMEHLLVHGGPLGYRHRYDDPVRDSVWMRLDETTALPEGKTVIFGHTPTCHYQSDTPMRIYHAADGLYAQNAG